MNSNPPIAPTDAVLSAIAAAADTLGAAGDADGWEHEKSKKELADIRKEIEHLTPAPNTLDGSLLIKRNSKESEVLKGRIAAQSNAARSPNSTKKIDQ
ncbi:MAG: hypothetical protein JNN20_03410 [Betaproteobacteria bacterium]|nr:hypothetical protein [Betaproteobacteria bacterium]